MDALLFVDAANVVGSRPDGWWHDRAAAAARLVADLRAAVAEGCLPAPVVVVLEGAARAGAPAAEDGGVRVVHAVRSADDALVEAVSASDRAAVLVTADRALRRRAEEVGATAVGPGWLLDRIGRSPAGD